MIFKIDNSVKLNPNIMKINVISQYRGRILIILRDINSKGFLFFSFIIYNIIKPLIIKKISTPIPPQLSKACTHKTANTANALKNCNEYNIKKNKKIVFKIFCIKK